VSPSHCSALRMHTPITPSRSFTCNPTHTILDHFYARSRTCERRLAADSRVGDSVQGKRVGVSGGRSVEMRNAQASNLHSKTFLRLRRDASGAASAPAVLYVGSHNFTRRAWGEIFAVKGTKDKHKLVVANFEVGVVMATGDNKVAAEWYERLSTAPTSLVDPEERF
jgi:hypothetical protein